MVGRQRLVLRYELSVGPKLAVRGSGLRSIG